MMAPSENLPPRESAASAERAVADVVAETWPGGMGPPVVLLGGSRGERVAALLAGPLRGNRQPIVVVLPLEAEPAHHASVLLGEWANFDAERVRVVVAEDPSDALDRVFRDHAPPRLRGATVVSGDVRLPDELFERWRSRLQRRHDDETDLLSRKHGRFRSIVATRHAHPRPRTIFGAADGSTTALRHLGVDIVRAANRIDIAGDFLVLDHLRDPFRPVRRLEALLDAAPDLLLSFVASRQRDWGAIAEGIPTLSYWSSDPGRYGLDTMRFTADDLVCVSDAAWVEHFARRGVPAHHLPLATCLHDALPCAYGLTAPEPEDAKVLLVGNLPSPLDVLPRSMHGLGPAIDRLVERDADRPDWSAADAARTLAASERIEAGELSLVTRAIEFAATRHDRIRAARLLFDAGVPLRIHGCPRWAEALAGTPVAACWAGLLADRRASAIAFRTALAVVNLVSRNGRDGVNMRVFDAAACGAVLATNDTPGLHAAFDVGREVLAFRTVDELPDLLRPVLADPSRRAAIRCAGAARARRDHTWEERLERVIGWLAERSGHPGRAVA